MNSSLPTSLSVEAARTYIAEYELMLLPDFLSGADSELQKLHLVYLHGKRSTEPLKFKTTFSSGAQKAAKMKMQQSSYDRFFLFGDPTSNKVVALFTSEEKESRVITRYHTKITPGCVVAVLEPRIKGTLSDSDNVLIATAEPLVRVGNINDISFRELPPFDIESENDIRFFHFKSTSVELKFVMPTLDLCKGPFCDGKWPKNTHCACVEKDGYGTWGIRAHVKCDELQLDRTNHQKSSFISVSFAKLVTNNHEHLRPNDPNTFNNLIFRKCLGEMVKEINRHTLDSEEIRNPSFEGFKVIGWFKPSKTEGDSFQEVHEFHIVSLEPNCELTTRMQSLKYPRPPHA